MLARELGIEIAVLVEPFDRAIGHRLRVDYVPIALEGHSRARESGPHGSPGNRLHVHDVEYFDEVEHVGISGCSGGGRGRVLDPFKCDASAGEVRFDHVEHAFDWREPNVDPIDDAIASEQQCRGHAEPRRLAACRTGAGSRSASTCAQASAEIVIPSGRPTPASDATAIPGQGFSRASVKDRLDIFYLQLNYTV